MIQFFAMPLISTDLSKPLLEGHNNAEKPPSVVASEDQQFFRLPSHPRYHNPFETLTPIGK